MASRGNKTNTKEGNTNTKTTTLKTKAKTAVDKTDCHVSFIKT